jgi:hypothetical protein
MKIILACTLGLGLFLNAAGFANSTPESLRGASAIANNTKLASSISMTKDADENVISFHVNGINPSDAEILLTQRDAPLSTEFTLISGETSDGTCSCYMLPTNVATSHVVESISQNLVNSGAVSLQITKQTKGKG